MSTELTIQSFDLQALSSPLKEQDIKVRRGPGGLQLKYIKGSHAIETANRIFGFGQWGYKVVARGHQLIDDPKRGKIDMYTADVELSVAGSPFTFAGGGVGLVTEPFTVEMHEKAYKEAETDGMKRALRNYGDQFGLSLYDEDSYIEGTNGEPKQVKDVRNNTAKAAPAKVVDAKPVNGNSQRMNSLYNKGKAAGKWGNPASMLERISEVLETEVNQANVGQLDNALLDLVENDIDGKRF